MSPLFVAASRPREVAALTLPALGRVHRIVKMVHIVSLVCNVNLDQSVGRGQSVTLRVTRPHGRRICPDGLLFFERMTSEIAAVSAPVSPADDHVERLVSVQIVRRVLPPRQIREMVKRRYPIHSLRPIEWGTMLILSRRVMVAVVVNVVIGVVVVYYDAMETIVSWVIRLESWW